MTSAADWIAGARPRTLGAGIAPVLVGTLAAPTGSPTRAGLCLVVALGLQVAVNYANDAADGARGIDAARVGPKRLVASGAATVRAVWIAAALATLAAAAAGMALAALAGPELLIAGAVAVLAMLGYSAGPWPYASAGLGEVMVFLMFGVLATVGTAYANAERIVEPAVWASIPIGLGAVAILLANNIRDIESDRSTGKRTLSVRLGRARSVVLFRVVLTAIFGSIVVAVLAGGLPRASLLALVAVPLVANPWRAIDTTDPRALVGILGQTAILQLQVAAGLVAGFFFG